MSCVMTKVHLTLKSHRYHSWFLLPALLISISGCLQETVSITTPEEQARPAQVEVIAVDGDYSNVEVRARLHKDSSQSLDEGDSLLSFGLADETGAIVGPMAGDYELRDSNIVFTPAFPLVPGNSYVAVLDLSSRGGEVHQVLWEVPKTESTNPKLIKIYPSGDSLPANHLKFYLMFDQPMQQGDIFKYFSLWCVDTEKFVGRPFRHTELWSADGKQLTLWFHPGRQKSGVNLNVELGAILEEGLEYELRVNGEWASTDGGQLGIESKKRFIAVAKDHEQPDPEKWDYILPPVGSDKPVVVKVSEPLDYALAKRCMVIKQGGEVISGQIDVTNGERGIVFTRSTGTWTSERVEVEINPLVEDLAGNSPSRPFEVDVNAVEVESKTLSFKFELPSE